MSFRKSFLTQSKQDNSVISPNYEYSFKIKIQEVKDNDILTPLFIFHTI